jgi:hypothetical protein
MALPAALWMHNHVSERELAHVWPDGQKDDGSWEDCLWCSVVEWLNDTWADVPDTHAYAEKLRDLSGDAPTGGSNFTNVQKALDVLRIPLALEPKLFPTFWSRLAPGTGGVANGSMGSFPAGHRLRRHDPGFAGGHSVYVARVDAQDRVWWCDPLAADAGYAGEWVSRAELAQFMGSSWTGVAGRLRVKTASTGGDMPTLTTYAPGQTADVKPSSNVRSAPAGSATLLRTTTVSEPVVLVGTVRGTVDPANGSDVWFTWWKNGRWEYTAKDNIINVRAPVSDCAAQVKAAVDPLEAQVAALRSQAAAAVLAGAQAEYDRQAAGAKVAVVLLPRPE